MIRRILAALAAIVAASSASYAHEIGKTQVTATVNPDGTYELRIVVDPDTLLTRLQIASTGIVEPAADRESRDRQIAEQGPTFLDRATIRFDGAAGAPRFEYHPASAIADAAETPSEVRLVGTVPGGASAFTFDYALAGGTFALVAHIGEAAAQTIWLEGGEESEPIGLTAALPPATSGAVAVKYFGLGFTHILPKGLDHILFVVGLFLLSTRWRSVLLQVSAFTLAHSITLGLTIYGVVSLPARIVEPLIALSIVYVAIENILTTELKSWRVALVFSFGLLHGMGFAGVLRDLGLPRGDFLTALLTFNLGVEAGQLTVVLMAFALVFTWRRNTVTYRRLIVQPASLAIASMGLFWTVQRLM